MTLIAVKREVAARQKDKLRQVFRGANVKAGKSGEESGDKSLYLISSARCRNDTLVNRDIPIAVSRYAWECVQSPLVVLKQ